MGALSGIRVVDLSRILAGPSCTQALADHGADVLKIEPPGGDETRTWGPPFKDGQSAYFSGVNRNKRGLAIDLAQPAGREVLLRLLGGADVLLENFKAGTLAKWGIDYDAVLAKRFPRLVHCRISGYGSDGPLGGLPGYDAVAQAMGGLMAINGEPDGRPVRVGSPVADLAAGMLAVQGIVMALFERERSGLGQSLEVTLLDASVNLLHPYAANYLMSGERPRRTGSSHPNIAPYDLFPTGDGLIFLAIGNDRQFARLCAELGRSELAQDPRFLHNKDRLAHRGELTAALTALLAERDAASLAEHLLSIGIPAGPVYDVPEILAHPQISHREMVVERSGYRGTGVPIKFSRTKGEVRRPPPRFAEHGREVLREFGFAEDELDRLEADGVVPRPER